ncbi:hypothetical protein KFZ56_17610 [Virgibacillus sp. NKC19-3]|uniref:hypothetical protein n=1 Tax=Virgibacillus saliphilus TaxID=2831674 RepID=UPI001C9B554A|nr:hypothetical protein [Virgibacillus sp. NKC19-3]MBY7144839.1 hypothetical protein [Virgibacillus sp. NKC19-3]
MKKYVTCAKCKEEIEHRDDLVACLIIIVLQSFHEDCYVKEMKGYIGPGLSFPTVPVNGNMWTLNAVLCGPIGLLLILFGSVEGSKWIGLLFIYPAVFRLLAYFLYERRLSRI